MDPATTILGVISLLAGISVLISELRYGRSPKSSFKRSRKTAMQDAKEASRDYKQQIKKMINGH